MKRGSGNGYSRMVANPRAWFLPRQTFCTHAKRRRGGKKITVSSAITRAVLRRTGARCLQNANFSPTCVGYHAISASIVKIQDWVIGATVFFPALASFLLRAFLLKKAGKCRVIAELTVHQCARRL